jgi:anaphase-promoting complex subunit 8
MTFSYGMVLAKDKNEEEAMRWLIRSVHLYSFNWGCWMEMTSLISRVEDVRFDLPFLHNC